MLMPSNLKTRKVVQNFADRYRKTVARNPPKYSDEDWYYNNKIKYGLVCDQERMTENLIEDTRRIVDNANDRAKGMQREVEHQMRERVSEIRFLLDELKKQKKTAMVELDALNTFQMRLINGLKMLKDKSLAICTKCLILREGRIGVDLVHDEVDRELRQEMKVIKSSQELLSSVLDRCSEQIRKLRAAMYLLDKDLHAKDTSLLLDEKNLTLRESQSKQDNGEDLSNMPCRYSLGEWEQTTHLNLETNAKELNGAIQLRCYIDLLLKQVCRDMQEQTDRTNEAFAHRLAEVKEVKNLLEKKHGDLLLRIAQMDRNNLELQKEISDKEKQLQLCTTRLSNRARRPGLEMTCDEVQDALYTEQEILKDALCLLKHRIHDNKATLRYLLHLQLVQEEELNIKLNTIKIDECDCIPLHSVLRYTSF